MDRQYQQKRHNAAMFNRSAFTTLLGSGDEYSLALKLGIKETGDEHHSCCNNKHQCLHEAAD